jgi:hypothetical protein
MKKQKEEARKARQAEKRQRRQMRTDDPSSGVEDKSANDVPVEESKPDG